MHCMQDFTTPPAYSTWFQPSPLENGVRCMERSPQPRALEAGIRWIEIQKRQWKSILHDRRWSLGSRFWSPKMLNARHGRSSFLQSNTSPWRRYSTTEHSKPLAALVSYNWRSLMYSYDICSRAWEIKDYEIPWHHSGAQTVTVSPKGKEQAPS